MIWCCHLAVAHDDQSVQYDYYDSESNGDFVRLYKTGTL